MTRFRVGLIVLTVLMATVFLVLAWVLKRPGGADAVSLPEPVSYAKPSADGSRVFVAFGSIEHEAKLKDAKTREFAAGIRNQYPAPGVYAASDATTPLVPKSSPAPLAAVSGVAIMAADSTWLWDKYTPDENIYLTPDGSTVVRIEGDWWKTKAYPAGKRLSAEVEAEQLNAPAITFLFADGRPPKSHILGDLISTKAELPHSPEHVLWPAGAVLNANTRQFHLFTQDSNKITFDTATGDIVTKGKNGLGNPVAQAVMWTTIGLTLAMAVAIGWWMIRARRAGRVSSEPQDTQHGVAPTNG